MIKHEQNEESDHNGEHGEPRFILSIIMYTTTVYIRL